MRVRVVLTGARRLLCYASILACVAATGHSQANPLRTQYLECVRDKKGRDIASQSIQTPVFDSTQGSRAYGVVRANLSPEGECKNTSTVYLAEPAGTFRLALQQTLERLPDGSVFDGNGIKAIQWSPSGTRLLIEVTQWTWASDSTWNTKYILLTPSQGTTKELPIEGAIQRYFAQPCARLVNSKGWLDDTRVEIEVSPDNSVDEVGDPGPIPSCVRTPTGLSFNIDSGTFVTDDKSAH